jgi:putative membrane protein
MKNLIIVINLIIIFVVTAIFSTPPKKDPNKKAVQTSTAEKATESGFNVKVTKPYHKFMVDEIISEFIIESVDARLMDLEEGKVAMQRSTSKNLKEYGDLMIKDQSRMLEELKIIAERKQVKLPSNLSQEKAEGLAALKNEHGESFDKKFIKMMILDHKRDVRKFEKATKSNDADIKLFATKYLPVVQSHLEKIRTLKKKT